MTVSHRTAAGWIRYEENIRQNDMERKGYRHIKHSLKAQIIELARNSDIDLIGFAPVERFENAPEGRRPADLLAGAKTVISLGIGIPRGVRGQIRRPMAVCDRPSTSI